MKFTSARDYDTMVRINQELINEVLNVTVLIFKIHETLSQTNSYGESIKKTWRPGVQIPCLFEREDVAPAHTGVIIDIFQVTMFSFLRQECVIRDIYPEIGDMIRFENVLYEINTVNENQLVGGQKVNRHSIICKAHLARISALNIEERQV